MPPRLYPEFEIPTAVPPIEAARGFALARVAELHPALLPLLDFCAEDPQEIAVAVGMVYPYEEGGLDDLSDIDFGPSEWFEPVAGLAALERATQAIQSAPESLATILYDPTLRPADVLADLAALTQALEAALTHETRFHFMLDASPSDNRANRV